jgi:hypothetical protein
MIEDEVLNNEFVAILFSPKGLPKYLSTHPTTSFLKT